MGRAINATIRPLYPRERHGIYSTGSCMGSRACLDRCGKSRPHRESIPGPSSPFRVAIPTELSWSQIIPLLSVVFCVFRAVHEFDFRLVMNETPNKWRPVDCRSCSDRNARFWQHQYVSPDRRRKCLGTEPTLWRSNAFCWVTDIAIHWVNNISSLFFFGARWGRLQSWGKEHGADFLDKQSSTALPSNAFVFIVISSFHVL
jgi:hypothetical protein